MFAAAGVVFVLSNPFLYPDPVVRTAQLFVNRAGLLQVANGFFLARQLLGHGSQSKEGPGPFSLEGLFSAMQLEKALIEAFGSIEKVKQELVQAGTTQFGLPKIR